MPPRLAKLKTEDGATGDVPWKSRFPVARIKKIMQADEDVGKVGQVVPVIISKAVELFMASMVAEASRHTVETGHKRVIPGHLKMAVKGNSMFDFLEPNVEKIPDPIHVESRQPEEKKTRRSRAKKITETGSTNDVKDEYEDEEEVEAQPIKKVKVDDRPNNAASRSMSIANLISPSPSIIPKAEESETNGHRAANSQSHYPAQ